MVPEIEHHFIGGVYLRKDGIAAGGMSVGHAHKYEHATVITKGHGFVLCGIEKTPYKQGDVLTIKKGIHHCFVAETDSEWLCIHRIDAADADLEAMAHSLVES